MTSEFKRLTKEDFHAFVDIIVNAYTGFSSPSGEDKKKMEQDFIKLQDEEPTVNFFGAYRHGELVGGMRLHDFVMTFLSQSAPVGGIGMVATDLLHKKEKVAKDIISFSLSHFREKGYSLAVLYPFRPDFYKKMGFGYGTKINQYRVMPGHLPGGGSKSHIRFTDKSDKENLGDCYSRYMQRTNGMIGKSGHALNRIFDDVQNRIVVYKEKDIIRGYIVFRFERGSADNFLINDIHIDELVYEDREVLRELLTFLNSQSDQIREIIFDTQDEFFHHLLLDVRSRSRNLIPSVFHESNVQGVGIMYRVIDTRAVFQALRRHNFNDQTCGLKLTVRDSFLEENNGSTIICFEQGNAGLSTHGKYDVEVFLDVSDFSSLLTGAVGFKNLYRYGLADISDDRYMDTVNRIFAAAEKPVCTAKF